MKVRKKLRFWGARGMDHVDGHAWCSLCPRHHTLNLPRKLRPKQGKTQENPQLGLVVHGHPHIAKSQQKGMNKIQKEKCKTLVFIKWIKIDVEINKNHKQHMYSVQELHVHGQPNWVAASLSCSRTLCGCITWGGRMSSVIPCTGAMFADDVCWL